MYCCVDPGITYPLVTQYPGRSFRLRPGSVREAPADWRFSNIGGMLAFNPAIE